MLKYILRIISIVPPYLIMKLALVFPGQGFQRLGLLAPFAKFPQISRLLEQIDETLPDLRLSRALMDENANLDVQPTSVAQPLILAASYAMYSTLKSQISEHNVEYILGHSLGEFTAYVAAGVLDFPTALKLVRARGLAMQAATPENSTGMRLVLKKRGVEGFDEKLALAAEKHNVDIANYNSANHTVLAGALADLDAAVSELGRVASQPLNVSGAFHSRYMKPAQAELAELVANAPFTLPASPRIVSNLTAKPYESAEEIRQACVDALVKPVLWKQSLQFTAPKVDGIISLGPGRIGKSTAGEYKQPTWYYENGEPFSPA